MNGELGVPVSPGSEHTTHSNGGLRIKRAGWEKVCEIGIKRLLSCSYQPGLHMKHAKADLSLGPQSTLQQRQNRDAPAQQEGDSFSVRLGKELKSSEPKMKS